MQVRGGLSTRNYGMKVMHKDIDFCGVLGGESCLWECPHTFLQVFVVSLMETVYPLFAKWVGCDHCQLLC